MDDQREVSKINVSNRLAAVSAAAASIVSQTSGDPEGFNYTAIGAGVSTMYVAICFNVLYMLGSR